MLRGDRPVACLDSPLPVLAAVSLARAVLCCAVGVDCMSGSPPGLAFPPRPATSPGSEQAEPPGFTFVCPAISGTGSCDVGPELSLAKGRQQCISWALPAPLCPSLPPGGASLRPSRLLCCAGLFWCRPVCPRPPGASRIQLLLLLLLLCSPLLCAYRVLRLGCGWWFSCPLTLPPSSCRLALSSFCACSSVPPRLAASQ
ncbi:hypothetical protein ABPG75_012038 [Micractinium tetrahymenae]